MNKVSCVVSCPSELLLSILDQKVPKPVELKLPQLKKIELPKPKKV